MNAATIMPGGGSLPLADLPELSVTELREALVQDVSTGARLAAFFGCPAADGRVRLIALTARDERSELALLSCLVSDAYPALTPDCPQAHWFEREIAEQWGVRPEGHPWLKPLRFGDSRRGGDAVPRPVVGVTDFFEVSGREVHEVAVGPVHAGIIEPGHFRFQCHGEVVLHLEISLGYQHRGIERALVGGPDRRTLARMEAVAGDTTVGHATAYCRVVEALGACPPPRRAEALRAVALELERLANHAGDLGALAGDVGFLPTAAFLGRVRGDFLNTTATLCGSRFGRGLLAPGGVRVDVDEARRAQIASHTEAACADAIAPAKLLWNTASVAGRLEGTGTLSRQTCLDLGLVGVAARACGVARDVRVDYPWGTYAERPLAACTWPRGDVFSRAMVRYQEMKASAAFARDLLEALPEGPTRTSASMAPPLAPERLSVALVEGWRGEICHVALTDPAGHLAAYKIVDPSFHNWMGLAVAMRDEPISDFPLCNKSFNLSYCGHDL